MAVQQIRAQPVSNWLTRLAHALALHGYATVDLRTQPGPQTITAEQLVVGAQRGFEGLPGGWAQLATHIQSLRPLGVDSVAMRAERRNLLVVLGRADSGLSLQAAREYFAGIEIWLRTTSRLLPQLKANAQEKQAIASLSGLAGGPLGAAAVPIVARALTALIEASGGGSAVTLHPVVQGSAFAQQWADVDLTSLPSGGIGNRNWLWEIDANRITFSADPNDFGVGPPIAVNDLAAAIAATTG